MYVIDCQYKLEASWKVLNNFCKLWSDHPKWTAGLTAASCEKEMRQGFMNILYTRDRYGNLIATLYPTRFDMDNFDFDAQMRATMYTTMWMIDAPGDLTLRGAVYVESLEGCTFGFLRRMSTVFTSEQQKIMFGAFQDALPIRIKGIFVTHTPWYFNVVWFLFKMFLSKKLRDRMHFLGSKPEELDQFFNRADLPLAAGGLSPVNELQWLEDRLQEEREAAAAKEEEEEEEEAGAAAAAAAAAAAGGGEGAQAEAGAAAVAAAEVEEKAAAGVKAVEAAEDKAAAADEGDEEEEEAEPAAAADDVEVDVGEQPAGAGARAPPGPGGDEEADD